MQIDDKRACRELHEHLFEVIDFLDREECRDYISAECLKTPEFREQLLDHISRCKHCQDSMYTERFVRSLLARCYCDQAPQSLRERIIAQTYVEVRWASKES